MSTFKHQDGRVMSAYPGSALEECLTKDAEWTPVDGDEPVEPSGEKPIGDLTVRELRAYAAEREIDLGDATKKADILDAIDRAAHPPTTGQTPAIGDDSLPPGAQAAVGDGSTLGD